MSITDELREWARGLFNTRETVLAIADRIDAEHTALAAKSDRQREQLAAMEDALRRRNEGELKRRWQREIDALRDERDELREAVRLSEAKASDMVELPKDADGEHIRIGDKVTCGASVWEVTGFRFAGGFWGICCTAFNNQGGSGTNVYPTSELHHYRASTVEDVLTEFGIDWEHEENCEDRAALLAEYAKRLKLAGEDDE